VRNYHRATKTRLPDDYGSPAFAIAWAKAETSAAAINRPVAPRETYAGLCSAFTADDNPDWTKLAANTQRDYRKCIAWMSRQGADPRPAAGLEQERCEILLDKAVKELGHRQGVYVLQFNRRLYGWVLERAARQRIWGDKNPWAEIPTPAKPRAAAGAIKRNRPWRPEEVVEVLFAAPVGLRRAYVLGVSGLDGSTMVGLTWDDWNPGEGGFPAERVKTGAEGYINVLPLFRMFLEEGERPSDAIVTNQLGRPFKTANTLQTRSSDFLAGLAKKGVVGPGLTLHGLRHTLGKAVAEVGGTLGAIQAALQHATPAMSLHYSAAADKKRALRDTTLALENWFGLSKAGDAVSKTTH
jgi:integrase